MCPTQTRPEWRGNEAERWECVFPPAVLWSALLDWIKMDKNNHLVSMFFLDSVRQLVDDRGTD